MSEQPLFPVPDHYKSTAMIDNDRYLELYQQSITNPEAFWAEQAQRIDWIKPFSKVKDVSWSREDLHIRWFEDGVLNASWNCLDRHLEKRGDQVAIIWEGDDPARDAHITYRELHRRVCRMANVLKALGARRGDRVTIYLPMIVEGVEPHRVPPALQHLLRDRRLEVRRGEHAVEGGRETGGHAHPVQQAPARAGGGVSARGLAGG